MKSFGDLSRTFFIGRLTRNLKPAILKKGWGKYRIFEAGAFSSIVFNLPILMIKFISPSGIFTKYGIIYIFTEQAHWTSIEICYLKRKVAVKTEDYNKQERWKNEL